MTKTIKLFISLFLFCFLSTNRSYAQNAYVLLEPPEYSKVKFHLYSQDSVLIDSFELVRDSTFVLKVPIKKSYYLKIVSLDKLVDYKEMDKIIPLDFTQAETLQCIKKLLIYNDMNVAMTHLIQ
jgi:hypothetical protein